VDVSIYDRSEESVRKTTEKVKHASLAGRVHACKDYGSLCRNLGSPKVCIFSLPHGSPGDGVVQTLFPYLKRGDTVIDGSDENYLVTQKRQAMVQPRGASYVGMGVSGGFSGALNGHSLMPSGDEWALDRLLPPLSRIAAKDDQGRPCVTKIGSGGSGHYVNMIHNGVNMG
jgi:6-phosphogluconate dehydrogenase